MTKAISAWKAYNKNVVIEINEVMNTIDKIKNMTCLSDLSLMIFTPKEDYVFRNHMYN